MKSLSEERKRYMEDLFKDIEYHLINDIKPSVYLNNLVKRGLFSDVYPLTLLGDLITVPQSPKHHPEGSVWNHTVMVVDEAALRKDKSKDSKVFMWAALLHDIGKSKATKLRKGRITSYDHDKYGKDMAIDFLKAFKCDENFINEVATLVRWHMQSLFVVKNMPYGNLELMVKETDFQEVALLSLSDRLGRGNMDTSKKMEEENNINMFIKKCEEYLAKVPL